jgi:hypothetical protein
MAAGHRPAYTCSRRRLRKATGLNISQFAAVKQATGSEITWAVRTTVDVYTEKMKYKTPFNIFCT